MVSWSNIIVHCRIKIDYHDITINIDSKTLSKTFFVVFLAQVCNQIEFNLNIYIVTSKVLSKISFMGPVLGFILVQSSFAEMKMRKWDYFEEGLGG